MPESKKKIGEIKHRLLNYWQAISIAEFHASAPSDIKFLLNHVEKLQNDNDGLAPVVRECIDEEVG